MPYPRRPFRFLTKHRLCMLIMHLRVLYSVIGPAGSWHFRPDSHCRLPPALQTHLPGYVENYDKLKAAGAEVVACVAVNDVFVQDAWGREHKAEGKVC